MADRFNSAAGTMTSMNTFMDKLKKAGKGVVDAGAKTMLKVRLQKKAAENNFRSLMSKRISRIVASINISYLFLRADRRFVFGS